MLDPPVNSFTLSPEDSITPRAVRSRPALKYAVGSVDAVWTSETGACIRCGRPHFRPGQGERRAFPIDRYYRAVLEKDPAASLLNSGRVTGIFVEELGGLIEVERLLKVLAHAEGFGDFSHAPRYSARAEIKELRLEAELAGARPGAARAAADYFLYSPGRAKDLTLERPGGSGDGASGLLLYAIIKARALGKRFRARLESGRAGGSRGKP